MDSDQEFANKQLSLSRGLGVRVQVADSVLRAKGLGLGDWGVGFRVWSLGF